MTDALITVRTYPDDPSAQIARAILEANGIEGFVRSDGASGFEPWLAYGGGYRLLVRREEAEAARELLGEAE